jgi:hypothetical protein
MHSLIFTAVLVLHADKPEDSLAKQMLPVYVKEISEYVMAVTSAPRKALQRTKDPIFEWSNPVREGLQQGVVYLWLREDGRPAVLGCIFSEPEGRLKGRKVIHELHALDTEKLLVTRPNALNEWKPQAGLERKDLPDSPAPAATAGARLVQMRRLAQEFAGHETDSEGKRWDLRLLPAPLYRYPPHPPLSPQGRGKGEGTGVVDGALFTLVSNAGTDPEVLLLIEAKETDGKLRWQFACGRFSDRSLYVQRKEKEIWTCIRSETNTFLHDPLHLYRTYADKVVSLDGKLLARVRATEKVWWGEFLPVNEK